MSNALDCATPFSTSSNKEDSTANESSLSVRRMKLKFSEEEDSLKTFL